MLYYFTDSEPDSDRDSNSLGFFTNYVTYL